MFGKDGNDKPLRSVEVDLRQQPATKELKPDGKLVDTAGKKIGGGFSDAMQLNKRIAALEMGESAKSLVLSTMNDKVKSLYNLQRSILMFAKDLDTRLDIMLQLLVQKGITDVEEFEALHDIERGIRIRGEDEKIKKDDIVWVDYVATVEGQPKPLSENNIPIRLGLGTIAFEEALIGKNPGQVGVSFTKKFEDKQYPEYVGKKVNFRINIGKVKTHKPLEGAEDGRTAETNDSSQDQSDS